MTMTNAHDPTMGHVGPPLPSSEIRLRDVPEMGYLHTNNPPTGEVLARGPSIFVGYFKNDEATRETLQNGWICTGEQARRGPWLAPRPFRRAGDVGRWNPNGTLSIIDRKKNIFKLSQARRLAHPLSLCRGRACTLRVRCGGLSVNRYAGRVHRRREDRRRLRAVHFREPELRVRQQLQGLAARIVVCLVVFLLSVICASCAVLPAGRGGAVGGEGGGAVQGESVVGRSGFPLALARVPCPLQEGWWARVARAGDDSVRVRGRPSRSTQTKSARLCWKILARWRRRISFTRESLALWRCGFANLHLLCVQRFEKPKDLILELELDQLGQVICCCRVNTCAN